MNVKELQAERISIFNDVYNNIIPKRVPVNLMFGFEFTAEYGGFDIREAQWNPGMIREACEKVCRDIYSDVLPASGASLRFPAHYKILGSRSFVMGANGFMQHPEVEGMSAEDYDYLISNPYDCLLERVIPRLYTNLDLSDPVNMAKTLAKSCLAFDRFLQEGATATAGLVEKYGYYPGSPPGTTGFGVAPFDFLSDLLRGFSGISIDVRRRPEKILEACDALFPLLFKFSMPKVINEHSTVIYPLHMPPYLREKDFAKLWWPSFMRMVEGYASLGINNHLFCEQDWMRYIDYLQELPTNTIISFEYGDFKLIKEKLGKKYVISGMYPATMLKTHTKEQCIDKAKEMLDILAPGGKYIFGLDKGVLSVKDIQVENIIAVAEYVRDNGRYSNAGEIAGEPVDWNFEPIEMPVIKSKYFTALDSDDIGDKAVYEFEERMFDYFMRLLV